MLNTIYSSNQEQKEYCFRAYQPMFQLVAEQILSPGMQQGIFRQAELEPTVILLMTIYLGTASQVDEQGHPWLDPNRVLCDACAQCIAICPRQALSWDGIPPVAFDRSLLPSSDQLLELFKERRSIRLFKKTRIERTLLEEIASIGVYAPTHNHVFKVIIVDDPGLIAQLSASILSINNRIYRLVYQNWLVTNCLVTSLT